ncbi:hypothetical protein J5X84_34305 [Streptosporangiaceae bacterium NEAU-GS5]|nr:hypothetical protein [Streptosporangiaceae bacterium NEAU-GS5]
MSALPESARVLHAHLHLMDRQVVREVDGRLLCKVDDLELADRANPYVKSILAGPLALGPRIGGWLGRLMVGATELLRPEEDPGPYRIRMHLVSNIGSAITVGGDPEPLALERWVRDHIIGPIPGSSGERPGKHSGERFDEHPAGHPGERPGKARPTHAGPTRLADIPDELRMSHLLDRVVIDPSGEVAGQVADVRLVQDGPLLGEATQALRVAGYIIAPSHTGQLFGYERARGGARPALVSAIIRRLHRNSVYATHEQLDPSTPDGPLKLRTPRDRLLSLTEL